MELRVLGAHAPQRQGLFPEVSSTRLRMYVFDKPQYLFSLLGCHEMSRSLPHYDYHMIDEMMS